MSCSTRSTFSPASRPSCPARASTSPGSTASSRPTAACAPASPWRGADAALPSRARPSGATRRRAAPPPSPRAAGHDVSSACSASTSSPARPAAHVFGSSPASRTDAPERLGPRPRAPPADAAPPTAAHRLARRASEDRASGRCGTATRCRARSWAPLRAIVPECRELDRAVCAESPNRACRGVRAWGLRATGAAPTAPTPRQRSLGSATEPVVLPVLTLATTGAGSTSAR